MPIPDCCPERKAAAKGVVGALGDACGGGVNQDAVQKAVQALSQGASGLGQAAQGMMGKGGDSGQQSGAQDPSAQSPSYPSDTGSSNSQTPAAQTPTNQWCPGTGTWSTSCAASNAPVQQVGAVTPLSSKPAAAGAAAPALAPLPAPWSSNAPSAQTAAPAGGNGSNAQAPSGLSRTFIKRAPIRVLKSRNP